ncbi:MAG: M6 family metalloprotease domain-containing protein [Elusimicrobia bacterium]|nr:M6 family metalloprotease domain-containing protein [Elusimicrobiota bacterium]
MNKKVILAGFVLIVGASLWGAPPAPGIKKPGKRHTCSVNVPEMRRRIGALKAAKARGAPSAPPTLSNPHVIVLRVDFSNLAMTTDLTAAQTFFENMRNFYVENSFGVFVPTFTVSTGGAGTNGAFRLPGTLATYGADCGDDVACNDQKLFDDSKSKAEPAYDLTQFDHVMIYHAGNGEETTGLSNDIWSVYFPTTQTLDGKSFPGFTVVPEKEAGLFSALGVICHEYGHQLGLPDLYDVGASGGQSTVGSWDLMDYPYTGTSRADGSNPPHLGAWSKKFLGFATVQSDKGTLNLSPAETTQTAFNQIPISGANATEYFIIEYRNKNSSAAYDKGIPMSGLAVWHIDDAIALNSTVLTQNTVNTPSLSGYDHRGVELVEADGTEANPGAGDLGSNNAYVDGQTFDAPESNSFSGQPSGVTLASISGVGTNTLSVGAVFLKAAETLSVSKVINYPNPAGDVSKYPVRAGAATGTLTTLVLRLTKPVSSSTDLDLDIYSLDGERIRSVPGTGITLQSEAGGPSDDYKWVYEYDWNGKNDDGDDVVSGIYLYRFKAGGKVETGKMVIVR